MLYPNRELARFVEKNNIPEKLVDESELLKRLLDDKDHSVIHKDREGNYHFNGSFRNADALKDALDQLHSGKYSQLVEQDRETILMIYEKLFDHQSFTGRSGTFYGYEGLGSIYWHMVSKLLLATQECYFKAMEEMADEQISGHLKDHYYEIKAGIGLYKSPDLYGAFPMDAYSHTPEGAGVKQPGLTGQVKEDIISRFGELGLRVKNGKIIFDTSLLNHEEILKSRADMEFFSNDGTGQLIPLEENQLAFTYCHIPVIYTFGAEDRIRIAFINDKEGWTEGHVLDEEISKKIFQRSSEIELIEVFIGHTNTD
jgi:hypothetical protein